LPEPSTGNKLSDAFEARLRGLRSGAKVRAIVMLQREPRSAAGPLERKDRIRQVRESARTALGEVDAILAQFHGRRLSDEPSALGYISVETTPAGIRALAQCSSVRGILEDQPVRLAM
jgi:hypothetical protein